MCSEYYISNNDCYFNEKIKIVNEKMNVKITTFALLACTVFQQAGNTNAFSTSAVSVRRTIAASRANVSKRIRPCSNSRRERAQRNIFHHGSFQCTPHHGYVSESALTMAKLNSSSSLSQGNNILLWLKRNAVLHQWLVFVSSTLALSYGYHLASMKELWGISSSIWTIASVMYPILILGASLIYLFEYTSHGGERIAQMMGGSLVTPDDNRHHARKLLQTVEEVYNMSGISDTMSGKKDIPKAYIIPTNEPNAFAAGTIGGEGSVVAITTGLLDQLDPTEQKAVIAHEIGHLRNKDTNKAVQVAAMIAAFGFILDIGLRILRESQKLEDDRDDNDDDNDDDDEEKSGIESLAYVFCIAGAISYIIATLLRLSSSRSAEYDADEFAKTLGLGEALASALKKIDDESYERDVESLGMAGGAFAHSYISNPPKRENALINLFGLLRSHPATSERVARLVNNAPKDDANLMPYQTNDDECKPQQ